MNWLLFLVYLCFARIAYPIKQIYSRYHVQLKFQQQLK